MGIEIEAKLKVDSHEKIIAKLTELGAEFLVEQLEKDQYFDDADSTLTRTDKCLRLRLKVVANTQKIYLTYKGAKEGNKFKKRTEIEVQVSDYKEAEQLLTVLGYKKITGFEKKRRLWKLGNCEIALDELPLLGYFVEIEGPNDTEITAVQENLGLINFFHIRESYAALMSEKLQQLGRNDTNIPFRSD